MNRQAVKSILGRINGSSQQQGEAAGQNAHQESRKNRSGSRRRQTLGDVENGSRLERQKRPGRSRHGTGKSDRNQAPRFQLE